MKASDNPFPSLLLVEQAAAPATPASGQARLYRGTDNKLYVVDDAGAVTEVGAGSGGGVAAAHVVKTAGNYTINNVAWTTLDATLDLTVPAVTGDKVEVSLAAYVIPNGAAQYAALDAVTVVGGTAVTSFSNNTATPASNGVAAWSIAGNRGEGPVGGSVMLTLGAGDVSGGNVTVRLRYKTANAVAHTVRAAAGDPLNFSVKNLKQ